MGRVEYPQEPGLCVDQHKMCSVWASSGECERNAAFMMGSPEASGACMLSCGKCKPCQTGDIDCINENRRKQGYLPLERSEMEWLGLNWWMGPERSPEL